MSTPMDSAKMAGYSRSHFISPDYAVDITSRLPASDSANGGGSSASILPSSDFETSSCFIVLDNQDSDIDVFEAGERATLELNNPFPGMWRFPTYPELCCIYRVPDCIRHVNPEAYTPQLVLIGPLHHSLKSQALESRGDIRDTKSTGYLNMEAQKTIYGVGFSQRFKEENVIDVFRRIIKENEDMIRKSYSESTAWLQSSEFVDMILLDSVFILELIFRKVKKGKKKTGDPLIDKPFLESTVKRDLILLENQLPYFMLEKLYDSIVLISPHIPSLRTLVTQFFFGPETKLEDKSEFIHFTDLFRCVRVETLPRHYIQEYKVLGDLYHADKLHSGGVKFKAVDKKFSLDVEFKNGCLSIPCFVADDNSEIQIRNIMALEQCHYAFNTHVCNYISFLDFLIDTQKDVDLLVEKGIVKNLLGNHDSVATMVNMLSLGVTSFGSYYTDIASDVTKHYNDPWNKSRAVLKSVYFSNPWRGTATVAATFLLVLTIIQTVSSIISLL